MKKFIIFLIVISAIIQLQSQTNGGTSINTTGAAADPSAILDISENSKGVLIPRVELQSSTDAVTIQSPATSLLIYNTGLGGLTPAGYYYNSGTSTFPQWVILSTGVGSSSGWELIGNTGTDSLINYIGTNDSQAFVIKTNNSNRIHVSSNGNIGVGLSEPYSNLDIAGSYASRSSQVSISTNGLINVVNTSHILLTSIGATLSQPWEFTLTDGKPGQHLIIELQSGYAAIKNTGNVKLSSSASFISPFSTLSLKWDDINSAWVELSRNALMPPSYLDPPNSYNGKMVFKYTGSNQTFTVPNNIYIKQLYVKLWGAGGGRGTGCGSSNNPGGAGAFVSGYINVAPGDEFKIIVGGRGVTASGQNQMATGGFGGGGYGGSSSNYSGVNNSGSGGGRSAIQLISGTDYVTAGGGGGAAPCSPSFGGGGGATTGSDGGNSNGGVNAKGGTTTSGGAGGTGGGTGDAGTALQGGSGVSADRGGGGGGGGYYGGGGGPGTSAIGGGAGGSSFISNLMQPIINIAGGSGSGTSTWPAPNNTDPDYISGVGCTGCDGLIIIYW